jgi:hypothetical protein
MKLLWALAKGKGRYLPEPLDFLEKKIKIEKRSKCNKY